MEVVPMRIALDTCRARHRFYGLSFWGENGLTIGEIVALAELEHLHIRVSTVGRLRAIGREPVRTRRPGHLSLRFEVSPSDEEVGELASAFDPPIPTPRLEARLLVMQLIVDFNMRESDGRIPALLLAGMAESLAPGDSVLASDGEGAECRAVVSEISKDGRYALLETKGKLRRSRVRPSAGDIFAGTSPDALAAFTSSEQGKSRPSS
jgi:hypothetical protein